MTGEISTLSLSFNDDTVDLDLFSFSKNDEKIEAIAFANRDTVLRAIQADRITGLLTFLGAQICEGKVTCIGFHPMHLNNDVHDMILVHIKRDT